MFVVVVVVSRVREKRGGVSFHTFGYRYDVVVSRRRRNGRVVKQIKSFNRRRNFFLKGKKQTKITTSPDVDQEKVY